MLVNRIINLCSSLPGLRAGRLAGTPFGNRLGRGTSVPRLAAELRPDLLRRARSLALWGAICAVALLPRQGVCASNGESIVNRASFSSQQFPPLTTSVAVTFVARTASTVQFLKYSPGDPEATGLPVAGTSFLNDTGQLVSMPAPVTVGSATPIDISAPVPLIPYSTYHGGETLFLRVTDLDQNLDRGRAETVLVTVSDPQTGDTETLQLTESGPDTGVFLGYLRTATASALANDGTLSVVESSSINAHYTDSVDGSDSSADAALVDPFGIVFDSMTGRPVDGATVQLIDAATGLGAVVLGDNGAAGNIYPHTVVSGSTATDSEGRIYSFNPGGYRFPFVAPGNYLLKITPPASYSSPSTASTLSIQALPGGPFTILEPGSRGEVFSVTAGPAIRVDIPVDPKIGTLRLSKSAGKSLVSAGESVGYEVTLENGDPVGTVFAAVLTDRLPQGFRYRRGSARLNGAPAADPAVSADGSTLTFAVGDVAPKSSALLSYVVAVGATAKPGTAVNIVTVQTTPAVASNAASASILVQEPFLQSRSIIMGRVFVGACSDNPQETKKGMEGVGIYLEDGSFVISDPRGMFHFEGVRAGTHVVQLDLDSIAEGYRILPCEQNSRFAGRAYSQFVDLQGGAMWRTDFHLARTEPSPADGGDAAPGKGAAGEPATGTSGQADRPAGPDAQKSAAGADAAAFKGEVALEMISSQKGDFVDYRIPMQAAGVPLKNLHLVVTLPQGAIYRKGSSSLDGDPFPDPRMSGGRLSYLLGSAEAQWQKELNFRVSLGSKAESGELQTRASLSFDTPGAAGLATPEVDNLLRVAKEGGRVSLPPIVLRPQFPTFGAELNDADRKELADLALVLSRFNIEGIEVTGHTDMVRIAPRSRKVYQDNGALSFARARSVGRYLTAALHLPPERLNLAGRGEREPVATNKSETGRAMNRRVEVKVSLSQDLETSQLKIIKERSGLKKQEINGGLVSQAAHESKPLSAPQPQVGTMLLQPAAMPAGGSAEAGVPDAAELTKAAAKAQVVVLADNAPAAALGKGNLRELAGLQQKGAPQARAAQKPDKALAASEERVELISALSDGIVHYRVKLVGVKGAMKKVSATLSVPASILYMTGTSRLSGAPVADPEVKDATITYNFDPLPEQHKLDLRLQTLLDAGDQLEALKSGVTVVIADADGKPVKTYSASTELSDSMAEIEKSDAPAADSPAARDPKDGRESENVNDYVEKAPLKGDKGSRSSEDAGLHVLEAEGILSPADGTIIASQVNAVRVVLSSGLTPVLTLDGKEIPADRIGFKMNDRESQKNLYTYLGVDFGAAGEHLLRLQGMDSFGVARFDKSAKVVRAGEITSIRLVSAEGNVADGRTPVKVRIQLLDKEGQPVAANAELALKGGELRPQSVTGNTGRDSGAGMAFVDAQGWLSFQPVTASGLYRAQIAYNKATLDIETYVKPKMRDWILVGLAEGTAGYNTASGHMENLRASGEKEEFYDKERLAFYAKGTIKGEWLLTMAYDSAKKSTGVSGNALFQNIDPNAFYTLYGDATVQGYEAASQKKLFLKVERDQFYAMYGDFDTGLSVTELSRYGRRLNGVKAEFRSKHYELTGFGSETGQSFVKDEIRGDGTSGLYRLSKKGIVINSEKITIETRDRFHSETVTDSRPMSRFIDYSIDYDAGTIFFKGPVQSKDERLDPVYIVVDYEIADAGGAALTYGGRAGAKLLDERLRLGGSYIHEGHVSGEANLYGADAVLTLGPATKARAEIATSNNDTGPVQASGNAYLAEVVHSDRTLDAKGYYREQQSGFGLGQQMGSEAATRKFGAEGAYKLGESTILGGQAYRQYSLAAGTVRDFVEGQASYGNKQYSTRAGLRYANDRLTDGSNHSSLLGTLGGSWKTLNQRLTLRADHEQALFKKDDNADFPTRTVLGADFQASKELLIFAQQELSYGAAADTNTTRVGVKATPWSGGTVSSAVVNDSNENGDRTFANVGLAQKWQLTPSWTVDGGLDRNQTIRKKAGYQLNANVPPASGGEDFSAVSLGANFQQRKLTWSNRVEFRNGETENKWGLITGVMNEQGLYWGWTGRLQYLYSRSAGGDSRGNADLRLGLAYRPPVTRWILLDRLDLIATDEKSATGSSQGRRIVNNLNANYRPDARTQISLQYGAKYVLEKIDGGEYGGFTDLVGIEGRYDLSRGWDIGLRGSMLHTWGTGQLSYSLGPSVGCNVVENAWLSLGYNLLGFQDKDFSAASFTAQGPFVQFRFKFDQNSVKDGLAALGRE